MTDVKPYTDEEIATWSSLITLSDVERRLLATLDERTRERDALYRERHDLTDRVDDLRSEAASLRERLSVVERERDEARREAEVLSDNCHDGECRACPRCHDRAEAAFLREQQEAASLREEVARLRERVVNAERCADAEHDMAIEAHNRSIDHKQARAAAERRAEEARDAALVQAMEDCDAVSAAEGGSADALACRRRIQRRRSRATHPPQQQTPAPADDEVERLRERVEQFEADARKVLAEECAPDERHCICVVHLRAEVARLRGDSGTVEGRGGNHEGR